MNKCEPYGQKTECPSGLDVCFQDLMLYQYIKCGLILRRSSWKIIQSVWILIFMFVMLGAAIFAAPDSARAELVSEDPVAGFRLKTENESIDTVFQDMERFFQIEIIGKETVGPVEKAIVAAGQTIEMFFRDLCRSIGVKNYIFVYGPDRLSQVKLMGDYEGLIAISRGGPNGRARGGSMVHDVSNELEQEEGVVFIRPSADAGKKERYDPMKYGPRSVDVLEVTSAPEQSEDRRVLIHKGDIITKVDGVVASTPEEFKMMVRNSLKDDNECKITLFRNRRNQLRITLNQPPSEELGLRVLRLWNEELDVFFPDGDFDKS